MKNLFPILIILLTLVFISCKSGLCPQEKWVTLDGHIIKNDSLHEKINDDFNKKSNLLEKSDILKYGMAVEYNIYVDSCDSVRITVINDIRNCNDNDFHMFPHKFWKTKDLGID